ncbi:MAG TPA: hypothetical protein VN754_11265, partial [Candidatus Binataceae bacterium]|nr:hypothetical protein [Candidatus Binataceae bacterium]
LKDSQVYELSREGREEAPKVPQVTWLQVGNYKNPVHNLNLCLALASIEVGCARNGLRFIPWGELLDRAPKSTREMTTPYNFGVGVIPDAIFSVEFPDFFVCFALELDLTHHGAKEYEEKFCRYNDLIFKCYQRRELHLKSAV